MSGNLMLKKILRIGSNPMWRAGDPQSPDTNGSLNVGTPNSQSNGASSPTDSNHGPPATPSSNHHAAGKVMKSARYKKGKKARNRSVVLVGLEQCFWYSRDLARTF